MKSPKLTGVIAPLLLLAAGSAVASPLPDKWAGSQYSKEGNALKVVDTSTKGGNYIESPTIPVKADDQVVLTCEAKTLNVTSRAEAMIFAYDKAGKRIKTYGSNSISGTQDWTKLKLVIASGKLPAATVGIRVALQPAAGPAEGTGTAFFRKVDLKTGKPQAGDLATAVDWVGAPYDIIDKAVKVCDNSSGGGTYVESPVFPATPANQINLSADVKCDQVTTRSEIMIMAVDKAGKRLKSFGSNSISGQRDWTKLQLTIPVGALPDGTTGVFVILQPAAGPAEGMGEAFYRNIKLDISTPPAADPLQKLAWAGMKYEMVDGAMKLVDTSTTGASYVTSKAVKVNASQPWQLTAQVKCENVTSRTQIYVFVYNAKNERVDILGSNTIDGTKDWTRLSVDVDKFHVDADYVQIAMQPAAGPADGTGVAYFKDVKYAHVVPPAVLPGKEVITSTVVKCNKVNLFDRNIHSTPFATPLPQSRVEIMQATPMKMTALQLVTNEEFKQINLGEWDEENSVYKTPVPVKFKKVARGYAIDVTDLKAWRKIALEFPGKDKVDLESMRLYHAEYPQENWQAYWIWFTRERIENIQCYLRGEFELTELPQSAMMQGAVDDGGVVYVNGHRVVGIFGRSTPPNEQIAKYLKVGKNVISAQVNQARYAAGLLVELDMLFANGNSRKFITDRTWRCTTERPAKNWNQIDFDDSNWNRAIEIARPPETWGHVPYRMNEPRNVVQIVNSNLPQTFEAGKRYKCSMNMELKGLKLDTPITMSLRRGGVVFAEYDLGVFPANTNKYSAEFEIKLSNFIVPGEYELFFTMTGYRPVDNGQDVTVRKINISNSRRATPPEVKIAKVGNTPSMTINGKAHFRNFSAIPPYTLNKVAVHSRLFREAGMELYQIYHVPAPRADGSCNFAHLDAKADTILANNPDALFIVKLALRDGTPAWMTEKHPDDMIKFSNGKKGGHMSIASEVRKEYYGNYLREMIKHIEASPYADRVIGYQANEGEEGQWMHYWSGDDPADPGALTDYSDPMKRYFRSWLRKKYKTDAALQAAWKNNSVTLDTAEIPDAKMRTAGVGALRDPAQHQPAIDYAFTLSDCISDGIEYYGKIVKEATNNNRIYGAMYGHLIDLGSCFLGEQVGYVRQKQVVESPYVDYFLGPISYAQWARDYGGTGSYDMPSPQSLAMRGKIWINENDLRTHTERKDGYAYTTRTAFASNQVMGREIVKAICARAGFYLFALGSELNWYDDPEMAKALKELDVIANQSITRDTSSTADVAVFVSDESVSLLRQLMASRVNVYDLLMGYGLNQRHAIGRLGAPFDEYLQFDIAHKDLKKYKLYIFINPYQLKDDEFAALKEIAKDKSANILFVYAPGIVDKDGISLKKANELTNMDFKLSNERRPAQMKTVKDFGKLPAGTIMGNKDQFFSPVPVPQKYDELIATYADGTPSVVRKDNIYFTALAHLPVELLREIADRAKVDILSRNDIAAFACESYAGFHSNKTVGNYVFTAPQGKLMRQVWPLTDNAQWIKEYKWQNNVAETRIFELKNQ